MRKILFIFFVSLTCFSCRESLEDRCERECEIFTKKQCPLEIGDTQVVDSMAFERSSHTIYYYNTVSGALDNEELLQEKKPIIDKELKNLVINTMSLKVYRENGYNISYVYYSKSTGKKIYSLIVGPHD